MVFFTLLRFNVLSRGNLIAFTFIGPAILMLFRNSEIILAAFGRPMTSENALVFNLDKESTFRNLRILTFRKIIHEKNVMSFQNSEEINKEIRVVLYTDFFSSSLCEKRKKAVSMP